MKYLTCLIGLCLIFHTADAQKKGKGKDKDKKPAVIVLDVNVDDHKPKPDSATLFTGIIKYRITTDDPADHDSMFVVFGQNKMRIIMFIPGYKEGQIFENHMIANFSDSTLYVLDVRNKTYHIEKFADRNSNAAFSLTNYRKTTTILKILCDEYSGDMKAGEDQFEAAALVSKHHSYLYAMDYNFLNIQPIVMGYRIVLGWRTKTGDNDNTYIVAYEIKPGDTSSYFDLSEFKIK
jgi:hypothetical protein